jgi:hypothetical protein
MSAPEPQPSAPELERPGFQYSLTTLLLLFVVLGSSLAVFGAWGVLVFGLAVGQAIYRRHGESLSTLTRLTLTVFCMICVLGLLFSAIITLHEKPRRKAYEAYCRATCRQGLNYIAQAFLNYHQANGCFPPAYIADKNGKPMHSWRVLILPYLDQDPLYKAYDFMGPWDGANNRKLLTSRPWMFACRSDQDADDSRADQTSYVAVVGPNAAWRGEKSRKLGPVDFPGGPGHTIMVVEVANSGIPWMEPRDVSLDTLGVAGGKSPALTVSSNHHPDDEFFFTYDRGCGAHVATADGSVHYLPTRLRRSKWEKVSRQAGATPAEATLEERPLPAGWPQAGRLAGGSRGQTLIESTLVRAWLALENTASANP